MPWLRRFAQDGGKVIISGDRNMKYVPQERMALVELGFVVIFFENQWSNWKFFRKCALLLHWWPVIAAKALNKRTRAGTFWHIPSIWPLDKGKLKAVSNKDPKLLKIDQQRKAGRKKQTAKAAEKKVSDGPLFEYAESKTQKKPNAKKATKVKATTTGSG